MFLYKPTIDNSRVEVSYTREILVFQRVSDPRNAAYLELAEDEDLYSFEERLALLQATYEIDRSFYIIDYMKDEYKDAFVSLFGFESIGFERAKDLLTSGLTSDERKIAVNSLMAEVTRRLDQIAADQVLSRECPLCWI